MTEENQLGVQFQIQSRNCSLNFITSVMTQKIQVQNLIKDFLYVKMPLFQSFIYSIMMLISAVIQSIACHITIQKILREDLNPKRVFFSSKLD